MGENLGGGGGAGYVGRGLGHLGGVLGLPNRVGGKAGPRYQNGSDPKRGAHPKRSSVGPPPTGITGAGGHTGGSWAAPVWGGREGAQQYPHISVGGAQGGTPTQKGLPSIGIPGLPHCEGGIGEGRGLTLTMTVPPPPPPPGAGAVQPTQPGGFGRSVLRPADPRPPPHHLLRGPECARGAALQYGGPCLQVQLTPPRDPHHPFKTPDLPPPPTNPPPTTRGFI